MVAPSPLVRLGAPVLASTSLLRHVPEHVIRSTRASRVLPKAVGGELFTPVIDAFIRDRLEQWSMQGASSPLPRKSASIG